MKRVGLFLDRSKSCMRDVLDGVATFLDELPPADRWECWYAGDLSDNELSPIVLDGALATIPDLAVAERMAGVAPLLVRVLGATSLKMPWPLVTCDDREVGRVAARELLRRGHRDLAFIANADGMHYDHVDQRRQGFRAEAEAAGARFHGGPGGVPLRAFLLQLPRPCGVLAMTDETGKFVLDHCRAAGLRVPQDLAVLGVDNDLQTCELSWPPLATVQAGHFEVGYRAARRLQQLFDGQPAGTRDAEIELAGVPEVILRASIDTQAVEDELVGRALQAIRMHAHEALTIGDLCDRLGTGRRSLEIRFKRAAGRSILDEIHWTRVQAAKRLLKNRRLSVEEVARLSGFGTHTYLGIIFRRLTGVTPTIYRRQLSELPR